MPTEMNESPEEPSYVPCCPAHRNRIIEQLELCLSEGQRQHLGTYPFIYVPYEVINRWEDFVPSRAPSHFTIPPFAAEELEAVARFHDVWSEVANLLSNDFQPLEEVQAQPYWRTLGDAAKQALSVFAKRGKLSEEVTGAHGSRA
jgi:hypothetical protein